MKKIGFVICIAILLVSCATTKNVFDDSVPEENTAKLLIAPSWTVKIYNGVDVKLKRGLGATGFTIPSGETELVMDLYSKLGNTIFIAKDVVLSFFYEAGYEYYIFFGTVGNDGKIPKISVGTSNQGLVISRTDDIYTAIYFDRMNFR